MTKGSYEKTLYIAELSEKEQQKIKIKIIEKLSEQGLSHKEIESAVNDAMKSKIADIEE